MLEVFRHYFCLLTDIIPHYIFVMLLAVLVIGGFLPFAFNKRKALQYFCILFLVEYLTILYCSTVFFRKVNTENPYNYTPFWSYDEPDLYFENIMNVIVFIPVGFLLGCILKRNEWWKIVLLGGGISVSIELLQLYMRKGFSEIDDVMHNTLGCLVGYGMAAVIGHAVKWYKR